MKGKLYILIPLICAVMCIFGSFVSAKEINKDNVPNNTYIIGNHMFTDKTTLSTKHIMLGATTIESDKLSDMVIYYKTPWGAWWDGLSGEDIQVPEKFEVDYEDTEQFLLKPTLSKVMGGSSEENVLWARMSINFEGNYGPQEMWSAIDGYELYTKNNGEYTLVNTVEGITYTRVEVNLGESKTYVARVYVLDANGQKVYSDYSNEVVLDNTKLLTPTLSDVMGGTPGEQPLWARMSINFEGNYGPQEMWSAIDGYELYTKNNGEYTLVNTVEGTTYTRVEVNLGESKTYVARVYALDAYSQKVYSDYSNEVILNNTKLLTPTFSIGHGNAPGFLIMSARASVALEGNYAGEEAAKKLDGYEIYEKNNGEYVLFIAIEGITSAEIVASIGESKTYVARVYVLDANGQKVYSDYSNELILDNNVQLKAPVLSDVVGAEPGDTTMWRRLYINSEGYYSDEEVSAAISSYELYEKLNDQYTLVNTINGVTPVEVEVNIGESKIYVARVCVVNSKGEKIYSDYSNEVVLNNKMKAPSLRIIPPYYVSGGPDYFKYENGVYSYYIGFMDNAYINSVECCEFFEKNGSDYIKVHEVEYVEVGASFETEIEAGTSKTYVARVRATNSKGEKVYSDYSNEIVIDKTIVEAPKLGYNSDYESYDSETGYYYKDIDIFSEPYIYIDNNGEYKQTISGIELYEKNEDNYVMIYSEVKPGSSRPVQVEAGTCKTFVAKGYVLNSKGEKIYSGYSNEIIVDRTTVKVPTLRNGYDFRVPNYVGYENGVYAYDLAINFKDYSNIIHKYSAAGYDVFEKNGTEYTEISGNEMGGAAVVEVEAGTRKVFVAKAYMLNSKGEKIYSDYSNELVIDNTKVVTPTLKNGYADRVPNYVGYEDGVYIYDLAVNFKDYRFDEDETRYTVVGYDVFEKNGTEYTEIGGNEMGGAVVVEVEAGTRKTFVAKAYILNSKGEKIYSDYSNELVIDNTKVATPTLKNLYADRVPNYVGYEDGVYFYDLGINHIDYQYTEGEGYIAVGYDIFEKNGTEYTEIAGIEMDGAIEVSVEAGASKTFVAKVYVLDSKGEKIYSEYSNELVIDNTKVATPTLKNVGASDSQEHVIYENGVYFYDLAIESEDYKYTEGEGYIAVGYDLFEKNGTEYIDGTEVQIAGIIRVPVEAGTSKTFVAKSYILNSKGEKIYSDYSNELVIDNTNMQ